MHLLGYVASLLVGISLGLIGGGGSILTIPILVYLFGIDPLTSTAYSLFVVGATSVVGSYVHFKEGNVEMKTVLLFGLPSVISVFVLRKYVVPHIPNVIYFSSSFSMPKSMFFMILFAALMIFSSVLMLAPHKEKFNSESKNSGLIFFQGIVVGIVTGLLGAGGGFLIIPALVLWANLSMKHAVGTSLVIISINSLIGFVSDLSSGIHFDVPFMLFFSAIAIIGILVGSTLGKKIPSQKLKPAFGIFVLLISFYILAKELL